MNEPSPMIVSDPLATFERKSMLKLIAPAKVNLFLNIGAKRSDGYHEVATVMHALSLHDVIHMDHFLDGHGDDAGSPSCPSSSASECFSEEGGGAPESLSCSSQEGSKASSDKGSALKIDITCYAREQLEPLAVATEDNIATKAIRLLASKLGREVSERFSIRIEKHIPSEAGLGGGSSDAAAALLGAARFWGLAPDAPEVEATAQEIGADVAFFLHGGCAYLTGVGGDFDRALEPMKKSVALIKPAGGVSTAAAYHAFDEAPALLPEDRQACVQAAQCAEEVPLTNNFTPVSENLQPELAEIRTWLEQQPGVEESLMCGSGSATFAICESFEAAARVVAAARVAGWWARSTTFSSLCAVVVP